MSRTTIATVTFEGDLRLSLLQALSIDRLLDLSGVSEYLVVLNGADDDALETAFLQHIRGRVSRDFMDRLRILRRTDMERGGDGSGWYGQQIIKLALSGVVSTPTYLMLDGKNHFIRRTNVEEFFANELPITHFSATSPTWEKYVRASLVAMDALTDERLARMMPTTTPYLMLTHEAERTMLRVEEKYGQPFESAIRKTQGATEFFLYYAHLASTYDVMPYSDGPTMTRTLYTTWPQDHAKCSEIIQSATHDDVPMFGLHRKRLPQLTAEHCSLIKMLWRRHLLKEWEDAEWFLAH